MARPPRSWANTSDAERYATIATEARAAFATRTSTPTGRMTSDSPDRPRPGHPRSAWSTSEQRARAGRRLVDLVEAVGHRIATGFAGTPIVSDALCDAGAVDDRVPAPAPDRGALVALRRVQGATTIWERWDGIRPDGSPNPGEMNSFNHYALGRVADWLHRSVAGLAPAEPGYRRLLVKPLLGPGITSAEARHDTPYGPAEVAWAIDDDLELRVVVPPNTDAEVWIPGATKPVLVGSGTHTWTAARAETPAGTSDIG